MTERMRIFDRRLVRQRRQRFAGDFQAAGFLVQEVADRLLDRLADIRHELRRILVLGAPQGLLEPALLHRPGCELVLASDPAAGMLAPSAGLRVVADEEALPFAAGRFDAALSLMVLHWVNDLPGTLAQLRSCLAEDGLLLAAMPGGETLFELRQSLLQAELECEGGGSLRVSPFTDVRDAGGLLQRAGFALPVVDVDRITVTYADPLRLMRELGRMGEANALLQRRPGPLRRQTLVRACEIYRTEFGDTDGRVPATFDILFMAGWKPHAAQPKPLPRGSAKLRLAEALRVPGDNDPAGG